MMNRFAGVLLLAAAALAGCRSAVVPVPVDLAAATRADVQLNQFTSSTQESVTVAADRDGVVAAWDSRRQQEGTYGVYARRVGLDGTPIGDEVQLNLFTRLHQRSPALDIAPDGSVWFAWESVGQDGSGLGVVARRFTRDLARATGEIGVNETRQWDQASPTIATSSRGGAVIAWTGVISDGTTRVYTRAFNRDGSPASAETPVGLTGERVRDTAPIIAPLRSGGYVVVWGRVLVDTDTFDVVAQRLDDRGAPDGPIFPISEDDGRTNIEPALAPLDGGGFVVAWHFSEGEGYGVAVRAFDDRGNPTSPQVNVADAGLVTTTGVSIATTPDRSTIVVFARLWVDGRGADLEALVLDPALRRLSAGPVTAHTEGPQRLNAGRGVRRVAVAPDGSAIVAWNGDAGQGDDSAACVTLLRTRDPAAQPAP